MDPITAIAQAAGSFFNAASTSIEAITFQSKVRWSKVPDFLRPTQFQRTDKTTDYIIGGIAVAFIVVVIAVAIVAARK